MTLRALPPGSLARSSSAGNAVSVFCIAATSARSHAFPAWSAAVVASVPMPLLYQGEHQPSAPE